MPSTKLRSTLLFAGLVLLALTLGLVLAASNTLAASSGSAAHVSPRAPLLTATPSPTCTPGPEYAITQSTGAAIVPGTASAGSSCDDCVVQINLPFAFSFYGVPYTRINAGSNGNILFDSTAPNFENSCLPALSQGASIMAYWDDLSTSTNISSSLGIFTSVSGTAPNRIYNVEWRTAYISNTSLRANFEVRLYEGQPRFDVIYGQVDEGGSSATVAVQRNVNLQGTQYECNTPGSVQAGLQLAFQQQTCGLPVNTPTPTTTPSACGPDANYVAASSGGATLIAGTTLVPGSQGDDEVATINLPFNFNFYGQQFPMVNASTNGNLQFSSANPTIFNSTCLPSQFLNNTIAPFWDDLDMSPGITNTFTPGIYTSISGSSPNRIFNIEWRACIFNLGGGSCDATANFEARLYEGSGQFDFVYGRVDGGGSGATVGVQRGLGTRSTQYECNTGGLSSGQRLSFTQPQCFGTPTPTPVCVPLANIHQQVGPNNPGQSKLVSRPQSSLTSLGQDAPAKSAQPAQGFAPDGPISFVLDDGTREGAVGFGTSPVTETAAIWLNRFSPGSFNYPLTLDTISVLWPQQSGGGTLLGKTATLLVYLDADGDNNPSNATLLGQQSVLVSAVGTFVNYPVSIPVAGPGDLYIGFSDSWANNGYNPRLYPAALDMNNPQVRSWVATSSTGAPPNINNLGANDTLGTADTLGFPGNFMIRAGATTANSCPTYTPTSTPGATTPTATSTSTPAGVVVGHLTWQNVPTPTPANVQTATLVMCSAGTPLTYTVSTDAYGFFTQTTGLANGTYNWWLKGGRHIANAGTLTIAGGVSNQEMGTMRGGDSISDNLVDSSDFNNLKVNFGIPNPPDLRPDFNFDGLVDSLDFNILKSNFGQAGAAPNCP